MSINSKKKGNFWENRWTDFLRDCGFKATRDAFSGGGAREKSDVANNIGYCFNVKGVKKINLKETFRQIKKDAGKHYAPALAIHFNGYSENQFLVVIDNWTWAELIKGRCPNPEIHL